MNGVQIIKHKYKHTDARGETISYIADGKLEVAKHGFKEVLVLKRKKGTIAGRHYHKGTDTTRNPEIQYIISGKLKLTVKDMRGPSSNKNKFESYLLGPNTEIRISPYIYHCMEFLENTIFLELHSEVSPYTDVYEVRLH